MAETGVPRLTHLLSPDELTLVASLSTRRKYRDGEIIHERGDRHPTIGVVVCGRIKLVFPCADGQEVFSGFIHTGQNYGDSAALMAQPRVHRAVAIGETVIDHISDDSFDRLLEHPAIVRALYVISSYRLSVTLALLDEMRTLPPKVRLAKLIERLYRASGGSERIELLQEDFSGMLGVSSVTLAKSLRGLEQYGLIETGYRHIRISDPPKLHAWIRERAPD